MSSRKKIKTIEEKAFNLANDLYSGLFIKKEESPEDSIKEYISEGDFNSLMETSIHLLEKQKTELLYETTELVATINSTIQDCIFKQEQKERDKERGDIIIKYFKKGESIGYETKKREAAGFHNGGKE